MEQIIVDQAQNFVSSTDTLLGTLFFLIKTLLCYTRLFRLLLIVSNFTLSVHDSNIEMATLSNITNVDTVPVDSIPEDYYESDDTAEGVEGTSDSEHDGLDIEDKNEWSRPRFVSDYCAVFFPFSGSFCIINLSKLTYLN